MRVGDFVLTLGLLGLAVPVGAVERQPSSKPAVQVSAAELLQLAERLAAQGRLNDAEQLLKLLAANPDPQIRNDAHYRLAQLLNSAGRPRDAAILLRQVVDARPDAIPARMELARTYDLLGDKDSAWREVRAVQAAGLPIEVARLVDRYSEALRAARPKGASFEIALAPDTNINQSTRSDSLSTVIGDFEIDDDSKATSGTGLSLNGQIYRRFAIGNGKHNILVRASGTADLYRKSSFDDMGLDIAAGPELQLGSGRLVIEAAATQRWYGMEPYVRSARLSASLIRPLGRRMQVQLVGSAGVADYKLNDLQDGKNFFGRAKFERALSPTTGIALNLSAFRNSAQDPAYSTTEWRTALLGWRDVGRATFTAEASFGRLRADDRLVLFPEKRSDHYYNLSLGATYRRFNIGGFTPVTRISFERNRSTVEFYDYKRTRSEFGITRAF